MVWGGRPSLSELYLDLVKEWDFTKNGNLRPEDVTYSSNKKVWWKCEDCNFSWAAIVCNRTKKNSTGCPVCGEKRRRATFIKRRINKNGSLKTTFPELVENEWDYLKNGDLKPENVTCNSGKKVWWVCKDCDFSWVSSISNRTKKIKPQGCPLCGKKRGKARDIKGRIAKNGSLKSVFSELSKEWDFEKNGSLLPEDVTCGSNKKVWWVCGKRHSWQAVISGRTGYGIGCLKCSGRVATDSNNLAALCPDVAKEWDYVKNGNLQPKDVTCGSEKKVWWKCSKGHSWQALVFNRALQGKGCKFCSFGCVSKISQEWLDSLGVPQKYREFTVCEPKVRVDAYVPETNTVYEFLGDFWHGNPEVFDSEDVHRVKKISYGELHKQTLKRLKLLEKFGYNVIYIWEKDFRCHMLAETRNLR